MCVLAPKTKMFSRWNVEDISQLLFHIIIKIVKKYEVFKCYVVHTITFLETMS